MPAVDRNHIFFERQPPQKKCCSLALSDHRTLMFAPRARCVVYQVSFCRAAHWQPQSVSELHQYTRTVVLGEAGNARSVAVIALACCVMNIRIITFLGAKLKRNE